MIPFMRRGLTQDRIFICIVITLSALLFPVYRWVHPEAVAYHHAWRRIASSQASLVAREIDAIDRNLAGSQKLRLSLAQALAKAGQFDAACYLLRSATDRSDLWRSEHLLFYASLVAERQQPETALKILDRLDPAAMDSNVVDVKIRLLIDARRPEDALALISKLTDRQRIHELAAARCLEMLERFDAAASHYARMREVGPFDESIELAYARALTAAATREAKQITLAGKPSDSPQ